MRVVSLVPSLTETLLDCGVRVVGRTRYCIHPAARVAGIRVVGGTKQVNWALCAGLEPGLVVMDREENTLPMAAACPFPWFATHIVSVDSVGAELKALAERLENSALASLADGWQALAGAPGVEFQGWRNLPGVRRIIGAGGGNRVEYMIWRNPWMAAGRQTFIGSMLAKVGLELPHREAAYPTFPDAALPAADTFYLFSSEPFPFARYVDELDALGFNGALVDGEFYSWFGSRSYRLLRAYLQGR